MDYHVLLHLDVRSNYYANLITQSYHCFMVIQTRLLLGEVVCGTHSNVW